MVPRACGSGRLPGVIALLLSGVTLAWLAVEYLVRPGERLDRERLDGEKIMVVRPWRTVVLDVPVERGEDGRPDLSGIDASQVRWHLISITGVLSALHAATFAWVLGW